MNTAETDILNKAAGVGGDLAPISRIGGGEVRVDQRPRPRRRRPGIGAARSAACPSASSIVQPTTTLPKAVRLRNYSSKAITTASRPATASPTTRHRRGDHQGPAQGQGAALLGHDPP